MKDLIARTTKKTSFTIEQVEDLCRMANLYPKNIERVQEDLSEMVAFTKIVQKGAIHENAADLVYGNMGKSKPLNEETIAKDIEIRIHERSDKVTEGEIQDEILKNASQTRNGYFVTKSS